MITGTPMARRPSKTTWFCIATVELWNGRELMTKTWHGTKGALKLKRAIRKHYKACATVRRFSLGNCWSINSYGGH